jgi:hypothetical protein
MAPFRYNPVVKTSHRINKVLVSKVAGLNRPNPRAIQFPRRPREGLESQAPARRLSARISREIFRPRTEAPRKCYN